MTAVRGDYIRAGIAFAIASGFYAVGLATGEVPILMAGVLIFVMVASALYGLLAYTRHRTRIEQTDDGLVVTAWRRKAIPWQDLQAIRLSYFASRRERRSKKIEGEGWMELRLKGPEGTVRIESTCEGFEDILRPAVAIALEKRLSLSGATAANLESIGISLEPPPRLRVSRRDREAAS